MRERLENSACRKSDVAPLKLLGGVSCGCVHFTHDQMKHLEKVYGPVDHEALAEHLIGPVRQGEEGENPLLLAGVTRDLLRAAEEDGLRVIGALLEHLDEGDDPVKFVLSLLRDTGYDVDPDDIDWIEENEEE